MRIDDPTMICNILRRLGWASEAQITYALAVKGERRIGEALIALGIVTQGQLEEALAWQSNVRSSPRRGLLDHSAKMQDKVSQGFAEIAELGHGITGSYQTIKRAKT